MKLRLAGRSLATQAFEKRKILEDYMNGALISVMWSFINCPTFLSLCVPAQSLMILGVSSCSELPANVPK
jgi:hypothetical protein